jgi:large subunit ribosomal protein L37Ae
MRTPRYGRKIRKQWRIMTERAKAAYECPSCGKQKLKRVGHGLWVCKACGFKMAGGAYEPFTSAGLTIKRIIEEAK